MGIEAHQAEVEVTTNAPFEKSNAAFHIDPEWQRVEKETENKGKLRGAVQAFNLTPVDFSPLQ